MEYNVEVIDYDKKIVIVKNLIINEIFVDLFDKLVLFIGLWFIILRIFGISLSNVLLFKNFN